jgi:transposase-like protein
VKVKGKWVYLYRAVDKAGNTIDFYLSRTRNAKATKLFLAKALKFTPDYSHPKSINIAYATIKGFVVMPNV